MDYGPTIAAAFGSPNEREIFQLRTILAEMVKRSPSYQEQKTQMLQHPHHGHPQGQPTPHSYAAGRGESSSMMYGNPNYSSNASTGGMMYEQDVGTVRSSNSYGVLSTGPVERRGASSREMRNDAVAGYYPTSRGTFQYP